MFALLVGHCPGKRNTVSTKTCQVRPVGALGSGGSRPRPHSLSLSSQFTKRSPGKAINSRSALWRVRVLAPCKTTNGVRPGSTSLPISRITPRRPPSDSDSSEHNLSNATLRVCTCRMSGCRKTLGSSIQHFSRVPFQSPLGLRSTHKFRNCRGETPSDQISISARGLAGVRACTTMRITGNPLK